MIFSMIIPDCWIFVISFRETRTLEKKAEEQEKGKEEKERILLSKEKIKLKTNLCT